MFFIFFILMEGKSAVVRFRRKIKKSLGNFSVCGKMKLSVENEGLARRRPQGAAAAMRSSGKQVVGRAGNRWSLDFWSITGKSAPAGRCFPPFVRRGEVNGASGRFGSIRAFNVYARRTLSCFPFSVIVFQRELLQKFPLDSFKNFSFALPHRREYPAPAGRSISILTDRSTRKENPKRGEPPFGTDPGEQFISERRNRNHAAEKTAVNRRQ